MSTRESSEPPKVPTVLHTGANASHQAVEIVQHGVATICIPCGDHDAALTIAAKLRGALADAFLAGLDEAAMRAGDICGVTFGLGQYAPNGENGSARCIRPAGHPPVSEDGIGHNHVHPERPPWAK